MMPRCEGAKVRILSGLRDAERAAGLGGPRTATKRSAGCGEGVEWHRYMLEAQERESPSTSSGSRGGRCLEPRRENDRDRKSFIGLSPSVAEYLYDRGGIGASIESDDPVVPDTDTDETLVDAKLAS